MGTKGTIRMCKFASLIFRRFKGFLTMRTTSALGKNRAEDAENQPQRYGSLVGTRPNTQKKIKIDTMRL